MLQPFERLKPEHVEGLVKLNKRYLVSQTYTRSLDHFDEAKVGLLFTDYDDKGLAEIHFKALRSDKYACILDLTNPSHRSKISELLDPESGYRIFWAVVRDLKEMKKRVDLKYKDKIRRYIAQHTDWRIGADEVIKPSLRVIFGELFITLKRGSQRLRVKFDEIEKA